jgi:hypothetical protein
MRDVVDAIGFQQHGQIHWGQNLHAKMTAARAGEERTNL